MPVRCWFKKLSTQPSTESTQEVSKVKTGITPEKSSKCAFIEMSVESL